MKKIFLFSLILAVTGCSWVNVKKVDSKSQEKITNNISFRLDCKPTEAELTCLNINENTGVCNEYGVVACGEKSIYSQVGLSWMMTASKEL